MENRFDYTFSEVQAEMQPSQAPHYTPGTSAPTPKKHRRGAVKFMALALALALVAGCAGFGGAALYGKMNPRTAAEDVPAAPGAGIAAPVTPAGSVVAGPDGEMSPEELYEAVLPSCVGITVSTTVNIWGQTTTSAASGSGFILTADGYIATNYHVIEDAVQRDGVDIEVTLSNGEKYTGKLVGGDQDNDIAVVKIDAQGLSPVTVGESSALKVAQWVCTVGNPLGELTFSFSDGRVSALDRVISTDNSERMNMLQTNCAINPGNSGGPLFDAQGRVVGIVTAKYTSASSGVSAEGLGFAIPIDDVKDMLSDIMEHGYVTGKPLLGVSVSTVSDAMTRYGIPEGAAVEAVNEGSCAEKAGIQEGDIITAMDGRAVASSDDLSAAISSHRAGDTVTVTVYRRGETLELTVTLDEKPGAGESGESEETEAPETDGSFTWPFGFDFGFGGSRGGQRA